MEFPGNSCPQTALVPDHSQLALAVADGLGREGQREAQQIHFTPEGIYLGALGEDGKMGEKDKSERLIIDRVSVWKRHGDHLKES